MRSGPTRAGSQQSLSRKLLTSGSGAMSFSPTPASLVGTTLVESTLGTLAEPTTASGASGVELHHKSLFILPSRYGFLF